jgi:hydroxylamine dehydrogenase
MTETDHHNIIQSARLLIIGLVAVIVVLGLALIVLAIGQPASIATGPALPNALENSRDDCITCHRNATPGIFEEFGHSTMAAAKVTCRDCHETPAGYPGAVEHQDTFVLPQPTTAKCQKCHGTEVAQYMQSRHSLPAWVAYAGSQNLPPNLLAE